MTKILVIEDDPSLLESILHNLKYAGFDTIGALDGAAGIELAVTYMPDLIISDIMMPELDGYGVLQALRSNPLTHQIPVIFLTARAERDDMRRGMELGADDYVTKPFTRSDLVGAVQGRLERQKEYQKLQERLNEVQALEQLKTDMIRIAAHDLRNPINNIALTLALLRRKYGADQLEAHQNELENIEAAVAQMKTITSDVLSMEHIEALEQNRAFELVDVRELVQESYATFNNWAQQKGQTFESEVSLVPLRTLGDPAQIREAIQNLVSNAIKYTPGGGHIYMRLDKVGSKLRFIIEDNGYGIPEEQMNQLFQPFTRLGTEETQQIDGTGLGLYLVKRIIDRHSGEMLVSSSYGEGSIFGFFLPLHTAGEDSLPLVRQKGLIHRLINKLIAV